MAPDDRRGNSTVTELSVFGENFSFYTYKLAFLEPDNALIEMPANELKWYEGRKGKGGKTKYKRAK